MYRSNRKGTNGYKKRRTLHLWGQRSGTGRELTYYLLFVTFFVILGSVVQAVNQKHDWLYRSVARRVYADTYDWTMPELASPRTQEQVKAMIRKVWGADATVGIAIARCESGYRPDAVNHNTNGTIDEGVFQVNSVHQMPDMQNPTANILYAYSTYQEQGTAPWASSQHCWEGML